MSHCTRASLRIIRKSSSHLCLIKVPIKLVGKGETGLAFRPWSYSRLINKRLEHAVTQRLQDLTMECFSLALDFNFSQFKQLYSSTESLMVKNQRQFNVQLAIPLTAIGYGLIKHSCFILTMIS